jgi:hypothetical protein
MPDYKISAVLDAQLNEFRRNMLDSAKIADDAAKSINNSLRSIDRQAGTAGTAVSQFAASAQRSFSLVANPPFNFGVNASRQATIATQAVQAMAVPAQRTFSLLTNPRFSFGTNIQRQAAVATQSLNQVAAASARVPQAINRTTQAVVASGQAARRTTPNYLEMGRVLQDLPFGLAGIQNNLTQLIPSVGLAGLAFSAVVSALTFAQVGTGAWTRGLGENKKAVDAAKLSGEDYAESLDVVSQAQLKGAQNAAKELTELKTLYAVATDTTYAYKQRKDAVDKLQEQYPKYFKNIKDETILAGQAKSAYDSLSQSIIATARARAAQDLLVQGQTRQLENESKLIKLRNEYTEALRNQAQAQKRVNTETEVAGDRETAGLRGEAARNLTFWDEKRAELAKQITNLKSDSLIIDKRAVDLTKSIGNEIKNNGADLADFTAKAEKAAKGVMFPKSDIGDSTGGINFIDPTMAFRQAEGFRELLRSLTAYQTGIKAIEGTLTAAQTRMIENAIAFNEQFSEITTSGFTNAIGGLAEAMGSALANGGNVFQAIGQSLLQSLGGVLVQLGEMAIGIGVGLTAIKASLESLNPVLAIAAGVALVALGSFFKGKASSIGGNIKGGGGPNVTAFANGGIVSGPTNALIGEYAGARNNPEVVAPLNKLKGMLGRDTFAPVLIPIANSKQLAILVKDGNSKLNRQ